MNVGRQARHWASVSLAASLVLVGVSACAGPASDPGPTTTTVTATDTAEAEHLDPLPPTRTPKPTPPPLPSPEQVAASRVPHDERGKIASLMMVGVNNYDDALAKLQLGVGGIFIPSWADPALLTEPGRDIAALRAAVGRPFAVSIDFEGGRVQRHSQVLGTYPSARELVATKNLAEVEQLAHDIGLALRRHGITVDFAPVLDVGAVHLDVIGDRSFSADADVAAGYGVAFARGLKSAGVAPVYKHFPGHGQASGDTHLGTAMTPPLAQLEAYDLTTYARALDNEPAAVMVGHMVVPDLSDGVTPSSLDPAAYRLLREGDYPGGKPFRGLAYTDDLSGMKAITDHMSLPEAVTRAVAAGADQALWSSGADIVGAIDHVEQAVANGQLPQERVDQAAFRVQLQLSQSGV